eukprot:scaffold89102_cov19-Tisochrysis_lutea.AAC.1
MQPVASGLTKLALVEEKVPLRTPSTELQHAFQNPRQLEFAGASYMHDAISAQHAFEPCRSMHDRQGSKTCSMPALIPF